ncbi:MAG TPA: serine hydroxymethyltransferase [Gammaproteobacteria bacterium]
MHDADGRIAGFDEPLARALAAERDRQERYLELIASENYVSPRVLEAQGSVLTNKYADGYPGRRYYSGCEHVDVAERLAIERARKLFGAAYANVQPYSGSQANFAACLALLEPGDTLLAMAPEAGGHRTHGAAENASGRIYRAVHYGVDRATGEVDYDEVAALARRHRPKLVVAGFSAYSRVLDWQRFRDVADEVGARLLVDMAHVAGLVAAGLYPNPVPVADVTTSTTHKTLRGPRGGLILAREAGPFAERLDAALYPGTQGGPLMHVIAAKAVAFEEALRPEFAAYQRRVVDNARRLAARLAARGLTIVSGGTDNHMLLVDLGPLGWSGAEAERALERAHIAVNRFGLPGDSGEPRGLRLGTPAVTTRGLGPAEIEQAADWVADVVEARGADRVVERVRDGVLDLCRRFPVYAR